MPNIGIDLKGAIGEDGKVDLQKLVNLLNVGITESAVEPVRFVASGTSIEIHQSTSGTPILVSSANSARINFTSNNLDDYDNQTVTLDGKTYTFKKPERILPTPWKSTSAASQRAKKQPRRTL